LFQREAFAYHSIARQNGRAQANEAFPELPGSCRLPSFCSRTERLKNGKDEDFVIAGRIAAPFPFSFLLPGQ
jgi:hypothetical protein